MDQICAFNLKQPLIQRDSETNIIRVNFDPQLTAVLREVRYLEDDENKKIPDAAKNVYQHNDTLWKFSTNLDLTVQLYNKVRTSVLIVEYPLIAKQLEDIDAQLQEAEKSLNWENEGSKNSDFNLNYPTYYLIFGPLLSPVVRWLVQNCLGCIKYIYIKQGML